MPRQAARPHLVRGLLGRTGALFDRALTILSMMPNAADYDIKILATDIDPKILAIAREGAYDQNALENGQCRHACQWFKQVDAAGRQKWKIDDRVKRLITSTS